MSEEMKDGGREEPSPDLSFPPNNIHSVIPALRPSLCHRCHGVSTFY